MSAHTNFDPAGAGLRCRGEMDAVAPEFLGYPRELALLTAPLRIKGALASLIHGLSELRHADDPAELVAECGDVLQNRLDAMERGFLLLTAARAAEPHHLEKLAEAVVAGTGSPPPVFDEIRAEASAWATFASKVQVRAILAAVWAVLPPSERRAFLAATGGADGQLAGGTERRGGSRLARASRPHGAGWARQVLHRGVVGRGCNIGLEG